MNGVSPANSSPDCVRCKHLFVTYEPHQPRGCRAYGFKSQALPSVVVLESSGKPCLRFEPRPVDPPRRASRPTRS